jgi:repressor LexA
MIEDHICSGDYVLAERTGEVRNGDVVVALVSGMETTLKRFFRETDERIRLQPANAAMEPIFVSPAELEIQGRVVEGELTRAYLAAAPRSAWSARNQSSSGEPPW